MSPRPIHHWKSFWLGLLIVGFLGWAWWDSHRYFSSITWVGKGFAWTGDGKIGISLFPQPATDPFDFATARMLLRSVWLEGLSMKFKTFTLPHWLLLISFLLPWSTFLTWRWHRLQRLTKDAPADPG